MNARTPAEAARFMMDRFCPYLPEEAQAELGRLVEELMEEWGQEQYNNGEKGYG